LNTRSVHLTCAAGCARGSALGESSPSNAFPQHH
jgi:hypothetical protein